MKTAKLGTEPVHKLLASLCTHTTLSLMLYSVYALTDAFFLARGVNAYAVGGVALTMPIMMVLGAVSTMAGTGGASVISRALGQNDREKAAATAAQVFLLFWLTALLISIAGLLLLDPLIQLLGADAVLAPYAKGYARIILLGGVTATGFSAIIRAEGNARYSLYIWVVPVSINLIFDPLFIYVFQWGAEGAAAATVLAQSVSAGMSVYYFFFFKREAYQIKPAHFKPKPAVMGEILSVGSPSLISQIGTSLLTTLINRRIGLYGGADAITAFGIIARIQAFLVIPQSGIVQGMQPVIGYNHAAGSHLRVKAAVKLSVCASVGYGICILLAGVLLARPLTGLFVSETDILRLGAAALPIMALSFPVRGVPAIMSAVFQAEGKPGFSVGLLLTGIVAVQLPVMLLMSFRFALAGIWWSFVVSDALMCAVSLTLMGVYKHDKQY